MNTDDWTDEERAELRRCVSEFKSGWKFTDALGNLVTQDFIALGRRIERRKLEAELVQTKRDTASAILDATHLEDNAKLRARIAADVRRKLLDGPSVWIVLDGGDDEYIHFDDTREGAEDEAVNLRKDGYPHATVVRFVRAPEKKP